MLRKLRALGVAGLVALSASAGCTVITPSDGGAGAGNSAGMVSSGGRGGTSSAHAGSAGKAGGSSATAGKGGSTASEGGASGEAGAGPVCPGCASGFCLADGTCVDCLASNDHCPTGQYCTDQNTCAPGCKDNTTSCASGVCDATHNCKNCISDDECTAGLVCGAGQCAPPCSAAQEGQQADCSTGLTCCSLHCADLTTNSEHCGACGTACGAGQFCGIAGASAPGGAGGAGGEGGASSQPDVTCHDTTLANLCAVSSVIVISDRDKNDTDGNLAPARTIGSALHDRCSPTPTLSEELQNSQDALNITTGHPVSGGGTLLVVAGGPYFQNLEGYFEQSSSPLYFMQVGNTQEFIDRSTGEAVVSRPGDTDNISHDFFVIQFMRDTSSGSLVLNEQGFWESGTVAAAFEFANVIAPAFSTFDKAWYAYEWTDMNGDQLPDLNEITLKASGP
jgi:hypothetical protein